MRQRGARPVKVRLHQTWRCTSGRWLGGHEAGGRGETIEVKVKIRSSGPAAPQEAGQGWQRHRSGGQIPPTQAVGFGRSVNELP
jgi:hypothetical protein